MKNLTPFMRLKMKRDTFFLPDPGRGVYFRNNTRSFQMKGHSIDQWVEKLLPMFNGKYTMENLTNGLPEVHRNRVYEIAEILYRNGFVQDISKDLPHQLSDQIVEKFASQIEFLQNSAESGAYRFQTYRQAKVLAIGSGAFLVSLISSLLESGLCMFHVLITNAVPTNRKRIEELVIHARKTDSEAEIKEIEPKDGRESNWCSLIEPYDFILYVSQTGNIEELRVLNKICREEEKLLLPALCFQQAGMAGPLVHQDSAACFESAWRSVHQTVFRQEHSGENYSPSAGAMLANVIVFELFKKLSGVSQLNQQNQFFLLDLETLEGNWHLFMPHPLVTGRLKCQWVEDFDFRLNQEETIREPTGLLMYFSQLTSAESGIFHVLGEEDLQQLPLAQCRVQTVDPLSEGPANLLPGMVCNGLTHHAARKEAGLAGIEAYITRLDVHLINTLPPHQTGKFDIGESREYVGFGAGETFAEAVCRGLQKCLTEELNKGMSEGKKVVTPFEISAVEDTHCHYYLQVLTTMDEAPIIGLGRKVCGFPVVWVGTKDRWYGSAGLTTTLALQKALRNALLSESDSIDGCSLEHSHVFLAETAVECLEIRSSGDAEPSSLLQSAMQVLEQSRKQMLIFEVEMDPILKKERLCVYGVWLREVDSR
ncbi:putative thiazole-containing bacteriocin maturation protein [Bacillus benzoevorans]|uniref:Putative thiazole-containing bacteriocin maturation protein n=1 Tax=Bacillus benzoevorans TaxID=1456 RepID=A0A7X0HSY4_9BACI|nr:putative thiazole-containing bacteriocin maturation protein [Bacillus benzoevorans]MBB6445322.1 putative thiazole-containing bacteriocin maturation protein [Bacillus benzoevorans]